jgi:peroxiredoxin family protein
MTVATPSRVRNPSLFDVLVGAVADEPDFVVEARATEAPPEASATEAPTAVLEAPVEAVAAPQTEPTEPEPKPEAKKNELLIIFESGDLERTWATLILATSAAASGMKVSVFLTFWGFYPLVKPGASPGETWMQKMLAVMNRPGIDHLKLSRLNFMGMGPWMMKKLAKRYRVAEPRELLEIAMAMGVHLIPCQMTMDMFGLTRDDLIDGLEEPAGAATVLGHVADGVPTLFI